MIIVSVGPVDGVNADIAKHLLLGEGDEEIAGPAYLVDPGDGFRTVGESGDGLGAAGLEHAIDTRDLRGHELDRRHRAIGQDGAREVDLIDAGDASGDRAHEHGAGQGGGAAGYVDGDALDCARELAETVQLEVDEGAPELLLVVGANAACGEVKRLDDLGSNYIVGGAHLLFGDAQVLDLGAVDAAVVVANRVVTVLAHIADDAPHDLVGLELLAERAEGRLAHLERQFFHTEGRAREKRTAAFLGVPDYPHSRYLATAAAAASVERSMKASTSALVTWPIVSPSNSGSESRKPESSPSESSTPLRRR